MINLPANSKRTFPLTLFPILLGILILFGPAIFTGKAFFWGLPILQFVPWWVQAKAALLEGNLPLWNPNVGMGAPLLANYQLGFFYPPNWFFLILGQIGGVKGIAWFQAVSVSIHLLWAGAGMLLLAREIKLNRFGQLIASLAFTFSGFLIARGWFLTIIYAAAWLPWVLLFGLKLALQQRADMQGKNQLRMGLVSFPFIGLILCTALQLLSGHAQLSWYTAVFNFTWMLFWTVADVPASGSTIRNGSEIRRTQKYLSTALTFALFLLAMFISIGLAAIQLIPTTEYLALTPRASEVSYEIAMTYSFWPWRFLGLVAPNMFGNPATSNYWGYANFWEDAIYIGLIPIILVVRSLFGGWRSSGYATLIRFLFVTCVLAFILALGQNLPVFPFLYRYIPTFDMFNAPTRWSILAVFSLALLAGIGSQSWHRPAGRGLYWTRLGTAGAFAVMLGAGIAWFVMRENAEVDRLGTMVSAIALAGFWALGGGFLSLTAPVAGQKLTSSFWYVSVIGWILLDLVVAGRGLNPATTLDLYAPDLVSSPAELGRYYLPIEDEYAIKFERYFRFDRFQSVENWLYLRETFLPNLAILNHYTPLVNNFDPLLLARLDTWIRTIDELPDESAATFLNLSNVSAVVNKDDTTASGVRIRLIQPGEKIRWFSCARYIQDPDKILKVMRDQPELLRSIVFIEQNPNEIVGDCPGTPEVQIVYRSANSQNQHILVDSKTPGWLFIAESWYPGWQATIDGNPEEILRADYVFKAVEVPAGNHVVELSYSPISFKTGLLITVLAFCLVGVLIGLNRKRS